MEGALRRAADPPGSGRISHRLKACTQGRAHGNAGREEHPECGPVDFVQDFARDFPGRIRFCKE